MNKKLKKIFIFAVLISNSFTMGGENKKVNNKIHFENNFMKQLSLEDNESKNETSILLKLNYDILLSNFDEAEELLSKNRNEEISRLRNYYTEKNNKIESKTIWFCIMYYNIFIIVIRNNNGAFC